MPFCPQCGVEYREGFTRCADCKVYLVAYLPEEELTPGYDGPVDLVKMATFATPFEAEMIRELLENNGITAVLRGDMGAGIPMAGSPTVLLVSEADLQRARQLHEEYFAGEDVAEEPQRDGEGFEDR